MIATTNMMRVWQSEGEARCEIGAEITTELNTTNMNLLPNKMGRRTKR